MTDVIAYGDWPSPLSSSDVAQGAIRLADLHRDGDDVYWTEGRPTEAGRNVIVRWRSGEVTDVLPAPWSARTSVHEYGGGAVHAHRGRVYFSNAEDAALYRVDEGGTAPVKVCGAAGMRFADMEVDSAHGRIICVAEDHRHPAAVRNLLVAVPLAGGEPKALIEGADFYAAPRLSPSGGQIAWLSWDFPAMPWDSTQLHIADIDERGTLSNIRVVAGGDSESVLAPAWSPASTLHFMCDRSGWWNLHRYDDEGVHTVVPVEADCAGPPWMFGLQPYAFFDDGAAAMMMTRDGIDHVAVVSPAGTLSTPATALTQVAHAVVCIGNSAVVLGAGPRMPLSVVAVDRDTAELTVLRRSAEMHLDDDHISVGEPLSFSSDGATAHAIVYRPRNPAVPVAPDTRPPLVVRAHGGPTSGAGNGLDLVVQFWTTRGFMFCDVNYRGSTGYGRAYRNALCGESGVVDVADCANAARHLAAAGEVDPDALFIRGGSAGGYIALLAVCGNGVFAGASSHYGVADPLTLAADTHKFESRYYDALIGPLPEAEHLYEERSPLRRAATIATPMALFQGLEDRVVPPSQTAAMSSALRERGIPVVSADFPGEGHGFRKQTTTVTVLEAELWFFRRLLGHEVGEAPEGVRATGF